MSDNEEQLLAGADPFHHEPTLRQEAASELDWAPLAPGSVAVLVTEAGGERVTAGVMSVEALGSFAIEALRAHEPAAVGTPEPERPLDEVALGGFLLFGAARASR